ncbi:MAG: cbb3-type cytochrome oxidase subunit 3 [Gammaproteobacteria bacterium]
MNFETYHSIWTVFLVIVFAGIVFWAWSGRRKDDFEEASRLPLVDDTGPRPSTTANEEKSNG